MSSILKLAVISSSLAWLGTAAGVASADGHEQARQLLQRSEARTEVKPAFGGVRIVAQDGHELARRMIEGTGWVAQASSPQHESVSLIVESDQAGDGHTKARNLLARPPSKPATAPAGRASARVETSAKLTRQ